MVTPRKSRSSGASAQLKPAISFLVQFYDNNKQWIVKKVQFQLNCFLKQEHKRAIYTTINGKSQAVNQIKTSNIRQNEEGVSLVQQSQEGVQRKTRSKEEAGLGKRGGKVHNKPESIGSKIGKN